MQEEAAAEHTLPQQNQDQNQQLLAYQRKYVEEYEGFKKLAARLQAQASMGQQGAMSAGKQLQQQGSHLGIMAYTLY